MADVAPGAEVIEKMGGFIGGTIILNDKIMHVDEFTLDIVPVFTIRGGQIVNNTRRGIRGERVFFSGTRVDGREFFVELTECGAAANPRLNRVVYLMRGKDCAPEEALGAYLHNDGILRVYSALYGQPVE